eukprot:CAMPEP_0202899916 /NCGR_PEP_ID=MMETSP1392-20130828/9327_1 /ASSEMBLY_ACC=CAM_ASM_000868 /TAXON_ID=225041 /ORGANISM="Chlamydomonas chlamydogama, Strain SAG 11-48b" /LENGTH=145 /DNA_ID=CAMNT_0049586219 /DNA_START=208 /DNA_END=645 /DNA_ORIENTATION=+
MARSTAKAPESAAPAKVAYQHILLSIMDANAYLSEGSKQALATAAAMAQQNSGKVTVLVVDEEGTRMQNPTTRLETISWHLRDQNFERFEILEKDIKTPASVLIGDVADELEADLVLLSSEAVHAKHVDANQLAEFVSCPLLLLP